jgi:methyl-accepting chemotaxis protein
VSSSTEWTALAGRAGALVGATANVSVDGPSVTVAFRVSGVVQGAAHARLSRPATQDDAKRFAAALEAEASTAGHQLQVVWCAPTHGPHDGEAVAGTVCQFELLALPAELQQLSINQTIGAAQQLSEKSVLAIGDEMRTIYEVARSHADGLSVVASQFSTERATTSQGTIASTIEHLSSQMRAFGEVIIEQTARQATDLELARGWTNDIVKLGQAITDVASNARMLTFSARLESARIGERGRGFAVIADSIQELTTQVWKTNQAVTTLAENLAATLPRLSAGAVQTSESARTSVGDLEQQLIAVSDGLASARTQSFKALSDSAVVAEELQGKANSVIFHLQFQDRATQLLADAVEQASAVVSLAGLREKPIAAEVLSQVGKLGRQLKESYASREEGSVELF